MFFKIPIDPNEIGRWDVHRTRPNESLKDTMKYVKDRMKYLEKHFKIDTKKHTKK